MRHVGVAVCIALMAVGTACSGTDYGEPLPTQGSSLQGPGTALSDELVVPVGARLLGRVFPAIAPQLDSPYSTGRWFALLQVDGDGRASFFGLVEQASTVGFIDNPEVPAACESTRKEPTTTVCRATLAKSEYEVSVFAEVGPCPPRGSSHLTITGSRRQPPTAMVPVRPSTVPASTSPTEANSPSTAVPAPTEPEETSSNVSESSSLPSTSLIQPPPTRPTTTTAGSGTTTVAGTAVATETTSPGSSPPSTTDRPPSLPGPGDLLNPADEGTYAPVYLVPGSVLAGPPMVSCEYGVVPMHWSVIALERPADEMVDAYGRQFAENGREPTIITKATRGSTRLTTAELDQAGGDKWYLTVAEQDGQPTWALIETNTDP